MNAGEWAIFKLIQNEPNTVIYDPESGKTVHSTLWLIAHLEAEAAEVQRLQQRERDLIGRNDIDVHEGMAWCDRAKAAEARAEELEAELARTEAARDREATALVEYAAERDAVKDRVEALEAEVKQLDRRAGELTSRLADCQRSLSLSEAENRRLREALGEVHRLAHDRPTKDILPIIHQMTEPWHKRAVQTLAGAQAHRSEWHELHTAYIAHEDMREVRTILTAALARARREGVEALMIQAERVLSNLALAALRPEAARLLAKEEGR